MSEWKVGDKVRLIGRGWGYTGPGRDGLSVGAIAIVDEVDEEGTAMVKAWHVSDYDGAPLTGDWATERVSDLESPLRDFGPWTKESAVRQDADLDVLKAICDNTEEDEGSVAAEAINLVLFALRATNGRDGTWLAVYDAIRRAYVGQADWGDD